MKAPVSVSEQLQYTTIRLEVGQSSGTGFIFDHLGDGSNPIIITNKHVIAQIGVDQKVVFYLHKLENNVLSSQSLRIEYNTPWYNHPTQDLCFCYLNPILQAAKNSGIKPYFVTISSKLIANQSQLDNLNALEDIVMIGYPNGLWDEANNLPLLRKGTTASHPAINFKNANQIITEDNIGVVDIACFPGSSGSPIFIINDSQYYDKNTNSIIQSPRVIFLGVLYKGPLFYQPNMERGFTPMMMNLGYYIKAHEINVIVEFDKDIKK
jgi:hypothetical protein